MATITAIETLKRRPGRITIRLDGHPALRLAAAVAAGLRVGQTLSSGEIDSLRRHDAVEAAYHRTLRFLGIRARSEAEIVQFLGRHNTPTEMVEGILVRLRRSQLADDSRFAQAWVENRSTFRPRSRRALTWELTRKGVPAAAIEAAVSKLDDADLAFRAGWNQARRLRGSPRLEFRRKLHSFLARRGFPHDVIGPAVTRLWAETHPKHSEAQKEELP